MAIFKVLTHGMVDRRPDECFVDENLLLKGIYHTTKPTLHHKDMTIKNMIELHRFICGKDKSIIFIENINRCQLTEFELVLNKT